MGQIRYALLVSFRVNGKLVWMRDEIGAAFRKGDELGRLDPKTYRPQAEAAESKHKALALQIDQLKRDKERSEKLHELGIVTDKQHERLVKDTAALNVLAYASSPCFWLGRTGAPYVYARRELPMSTRT